MAPDPSPSTSLYDPRTMMTVAVDDIRDQVEIVTKANPVPPNVLEPFLRHRLRKRGLLGWIARTFRFFGKPAGPPIALGVMYRPKILGFTAHTTIYWYIVAPRLLGGTSKKLVYLTASNQALAGPEALVQYAGGNDAVFRVYDGEQGTFVVTIPYTNPIYRQHETTLSIAGASHGALYVANRTSGGGQSWQNEVFLYNPQTAKFSLVWHYAFQWDQANSPTLDWGPIIEIPNGDQFGKTNRVGHSDARLISDTGDFQLTPGNTRFRINAEHEFEVRHVVENYEMLAD